MNDMGSKHGQRDLDEAMSDLAGHLGLDFVGEVAKRVFDRLWLDPEERRRRLLEQNGSAPSSDER